MPAETGTSFPDPGSLQRGRFTYFPVVPGRMEFAIEVRQAILRDRPEVIAVELPDTVDLPIVDTAPGVRGNSATGRTKPATLSTGHVIQVPEHLDPGVNVRVDTRTGEYLGRAN